MPQCVLPLYHMLRRSIGRMCATTRAPDGHGGRILACASARVSCRAVQIATVGVLWKLLTVAESNILHMDTGRPPRPKNSGPKLKQTNDPLSHAISRRPFRHAPVHHEKFGQMPANTRKRRSHAEEPA